MEIKNISNKIQQEFIEPKSDDLLKENSNIIKEEYIEKLKNDNIIFNGKTFLINKKGTEYKNKKNIKRIIYKCANNRHDEKLRQQTKQKTFCNATIEFIFPGQNCKSGYFFKKDHSDECINMYIDFPKKIKINELNKEKFVQMCEDVMNSSNIYDRNLFKDEFKKIYNNPENNFNFPINNTYLGNIISNWKNKSYKFTKASVLYNKYDYNQRLILREFKTISLQTEKKNNPIKYEYIIWANDENLNRISKSNHLFIDGTFHHPIDYCQLLIIMYKDIITDLKIPGIYILLNSKNEDLYNMVFEDVINLITWKGKKEINIKTIVTDSEKALMNSIKKYFPTSQRVACYFHYKQDIVRNIRSYGLYKDEMKKQSNEVIKILSSILYIYKGNIEIVNKILEDTKKSHKYHSNFIENYFKINKMPYFIDNSLNYDIIPDDCRTNNFLENYNGYIKHILGKHRIINWVNFIHFIKSESGRSIEKLMNSNNNNLKIFKMLIEKEKIIKKEKNKFNKEIIKPTDEVNDNNEKKLEKSKKLEDKLDKV